MGGGQPTKDVSTLVSQATGSARAAAAAAKNVISWFEIEPSHADSLVWFERFTKACPLAHQHYHQVEEALRAMPEVSRKDHTSQVIEYAKIYQGMQDFMNQVISMVEAYGPPSDEFRRLWDEFVGKMQIT